MLQGYSRKSYPLIGIFSLQRLRQVTHPGLAAESDSHAKWTQSQKPSSLGRHLYRMDSDFSGETEEAPEVTKVFLSEIISSGRLEKLMVSMTTLKETDSRNPVSVG